MFGQQKSGRNKRGVRIYEGVVRRDSTVTVFVTGLGAIFCHSVFKDFPSFHVLGSPSDSLF